MAVGVICVYLRSTTSAAGATFAASEELDVFHDDFETRTLLAARLVVPCIELQATFRVEGFPLFAVFADNFGDSAKGFEVYKCNLLAFFAG